MKPPEAKGLQYFVGRGDVLEQVKANANNAQVIHIIYDTEGIAGIGKTTLFVKLYDELSKYDDSALQVWLSMGYFSDSTGEDRELEVRQCPKLMLELAHSLPRFPLAEFERYADTEWNNSGRKIEFKGTIKTGDIRIGAFAQVHESQLETGNVVFNENPERFFEAMNSARDRITRQFVSSYNALSAEQRIVLFVDQFNYVAKSDIGRWFLKDLVPNLDNTLVLVARSTGQVHELESVQDFVVPNKLRNFSQGEVSAYLNKRLQYPPGTDYPLLEQRIYDISSGHPQAMALAVDLVEEHGLETSNLLKVFDKLDEYAPLQELFAGIVSEVDDNMRRAIEAGSVVRRFDALLLRHLLAEANDSEDTNSSWYTDIITRLEEYSFTEYYRETSEQPAYYKFHDFIRRIASDRLRRNDPTRYEELHRLAAEYYAKRVTDFEEEKSDISAYELWYLYETSEWQTLKSEWLYHHYHLSDHATSGFHFARVYLDMFWWWAWYVPFPFCEQLLKEWEAWNKANDEWLRLLQEFHYAFPTGYEKVGKGQWDDVENALLDLRCLARCNGEISRLDDDRRHFRALSNCFLALSYQYRGIKYKDAEGLYKEAQYIFETQPGEKDKINVPWVLYHLSNLYMEQKNDNQALSFSQRVLMHEMKEAEERRDYEVMANAHRVQADVWWHRSDPLRAFHSYARALLCAYTFQGWPLLNDMPKPGNLYTAELYREITDRIMKRLDALRYMDQTTASKVLELLNDFWAPYWDSTAGPRNLEKHQLQDLESVLFPPKQTAKDLGNWELGRRVIRVARKMKDKLGPQLDVLEEPSTKLQ